MMDEGSPRGGGGEMDGSAGSNGRPPNPLAGAYRPCFAGAGGGGSNLRTVPVQKKFLDVMIGVEESKEVCDSDYIPIVRSGAWSDIGFRRTMEDVLVCSDNFLRDYGQNNSEGPSAFYGVFDGHGGKHAADFACSNLPKFLAEDVDFPTEIERAVTSAFLQTDSAFAAACSLNSSLESGTTALTALVVGRSLVVANVGDCRAVLCRRGKAIEMSHDHKPCCSKEQKRIEALGGFVYDGYLNGQLSVARAIGDWHMEGLKHGDGLGPLSAEPEVMKMRLTEEDEFLIIGCDGLWDVFLNQNAVDFARRKLQEHNDPMTCCKQLIEEALKRDSGDNLAVVIVCFHSKPPPSLTAIRPRVHRSISAEGLQELKSFLGLPG